MTDFRDYLACNDVVDWRDPVVRQRAQELALADPVDTARNCYQFVRDRISHSLDIDATQLTCAASEVLREGHGYCYAKSHLLVALLRANGIPAGFDYQRLDDGEGGLVLHGIVTLCLPEYNWYRVDPRGGKAGANAIFSPPLEQLAWPGDEPGEENYRVNLSRPVPRVVEALRQPKSVQQLLPDLPREI